MRMNGHGNVVRQRRHFDGENAFSNHVASAHSDDANAEHAFGLGIDEQLRHAFRAVERSRAARCGPGKFRNFDFTAIFFSLRFGETSPGNFRISEDDGRNRRRFECDFMSGNGFHGGAAFVHGLVRQHRFAGHIADRIDRGIGGLQLLVDFDESARTYYDLGFFEAGDL